MMEAVTNLVIAFNQIWLRSFWLNTIFFVGTLFYLLQKKSVKITSAWHHKEYRARPGPTGLPIVGNLHQLGRKPHEQMTEWSKQYGDVFFVQMGKWPTVVLNRLPAIKTALVKQAGDFSGRPEFYTFRFIGNGKSMGFGNYGPRWKMHRKIAQNALMLFVNSKQNPVADTIINEAKVLVRNLTEHSEGSGTDPHDEIYLSVGSIICMICFGKQYKREDEDFQKLIKVNADFMAFVRAGNPVDVLPWTRHFMKRALDRFVGMLNIMDEFCNKKHREHEVDYVDGQVRDVTDALIRTVGSVDDTDKKAVGLTDSHILTTVQEMIAAGFDTIATTLHWALLYMVTHPEAQKRAQNEIDDVIGHERYPNMEDMKSLPYTEACICEVMRMSCIFPFALPHATTRDTQLNNHVIPDKTLVFVNLWSVSRDDERFPEPHSFKPERFLTNAGTLDQSLVDSFLPYGVGRRRCPGEPLAKIEMFLFFSVLLQRCSLRKVAGQEYCLDSNFGLTLKPKDYKLIVEERFPQ